jgi:hypothetical protein
VGAELKQCGISAEVNSAAFAAACSGDSMVRCCPARVVTDTSLPRGRQNASAVGRHASRSCGTNKVIAPG